jgi:hypothetical protein
VLGRGEPQEVADQLGLEGEQVGPGRPEGRARALRRRGRGRVGEGREVPAGEPGLGEMPRADPGDPVDLGHHAAGAGSRPCGERQRLGMLAGAEVAARDRPAGEVGLDRVDQGQDLGALSLALGELRQAVADQPLDLHAPGLHGLFLGARALPVALVADPRQLRPVLAAAAQIARHGRGRRGGPGGLAPQRELVDAVGARVVGILLEPGLELGVGGAVGGRVQVALPEHVAEQDGIAEPGDQPIRGGEVAGGLQLEDLPVAPDVAAVERTGPGPIGGARRRLGEVKHGDHVLRGAVGRPGGRQDGGPERRQKDSVPNRRRAACPLHAATVLRF